MDDLIFRTGPSEVIFDNIRNFLHTCNYWNSFDFACPDILSCKKCYVKFDIWNGNLFLAFANSTFLLCKFKFCHNRRNHFRLQVWIYILGNSLTSPKLYILSIINTWKELLSAAIWADQKWAGFWQIYLLLVKKRWNSKKKTKPT